MKVLRVVSIFIVALILVIVVMVSGCNTVETDENIMFHCPVSINNRCVVCGYEL